MGRIGMFNLKIYTQVVTSIHTHTHRRTQTRRYMMQQFYRWMGELRGYRSSQNLVYGHLPKILLILKADWKGNHGQKGYSVQRLVAKVNKDTVANG